MRARIGRTPAAALAVLAGIGLLLASWYAAGSRAARQEASLVSGEPLAEVEREAERLAEHLATRLEALRLSESRRPFVDYQGHGWVDACSCEPATRSPLAAGPADPLVWAHFQIDEVGQLTMPTLGTGAGGGRVPEQRREVRAIQRAILERLECAASERLASRGRQPASFDAPPPGGVGREGLILVGPFRWDTVPVDDRPALVALREVVTPGAVLAQGFVVRDGALDALLGETPHPTRVRPGPPEGPGQARIPLEGDPWSVVIDASAAMDAAVVASGKVVADFHKTFSLGVVAALLVGGLVVGLVSQADRLARQRARFAAAAAHELRTPLASLRLYGEMLADGAGDPEQRASYARRIASEAERLGRVVGNVLEYSRLERGGPGVRCEADDLGAAVRESVEQLRTPVETSGARLELAIEEPLAPARFDRDAVHQILQNLLDNAVKHGREARDRTVRVRVHRSEQGPVLSVVDRGPGVAPALRRRLFHPFTRQVKAGGPPGLGLGLALVRGLAEAQEARVSHADVEGGGSRFSVGFRWA